MWRYGIIIASGIVGLMLGMVLQSAIDARGDIAIPSLAVVIIVIVICGILGGLRNWFTEDVSSARPWTKFLGRSVDGIIAAAAVPLFLSIIGNEKITAVFGKVDFSNSAYEIALLILTGFCLLAAVYSQKFLDSLSKKFMQLSEKVEEVDAKVEKVNAIADLQVEPEATRGDGEKRTRPRVKGLSDDQKKVLKALASGQFLMRTADGLAGQTKLPLVAVEDILLQLKKGELVQELSTAKGVRWAISDEGRIELGSDDE